MSGLPCVDNSRSKAGREFLEGPTGPLFAIWALRLKRYYIPLAVLENTPAPSFEYQGIVFVNCGPGNIVTWFLSRRKFAYYLVY